MSAARIAVLGANAAGKAAAVDLALAGHEVVLWDRRGGTETALRYDGIFGDGTVELAEVTADLADAVREASLVVVATLDIRREHLERELLAALRPSQTAVFARGGSLASLRLVTLGCDTALEELPLLVELSCFPYSSRLGADGCVHVKTKRRVAAAAWPAPLTQVHLEGFARLWIELVPARDVLHCALLNPNYVLHPPAMIANLGSYDRRDPVEHEGLTPASRRLVEVLDGEHMAIMAAYGYATPTVSEIIGDLAPLAAPSVGSTSQPWPAEPLLERFIVEDILVGLNLLSVLARAARIDAPIVESFVSVFGAALPSEVWAARFVPAEVGWTDEPTPELVRRSLDVAFSTVGVGRV